MTMPDNPFTNSTLSEEIIDKVVILLCSGLGRAALANAVTGMGLDPEQVATAIAEGRTRIQIAARWDRDEQLGTSLTRLNDIYRRALAVQDGKTALAAQRELNKMLGLYTPTMKKDDAPHQAAAANPLAGLRIVGA